MKQARFPWFNEAQAPRDVPAAYVIACKSEAQAVTESLAIAKRLYGLTRQQIAKRCEWKSQTFLSEIAKDQKAMPESKYELFCMATGCNLLMQFHDKQTDSRRMAGQLSEREKSEAVAAACIAQWGRAA